MRIQKWLAVVTLAGIVPCIGCTDEAAFEAGRSAGSSVALSIVVFVLVIAFMALSLRYGAALRRRKRMGAWLAGGGHLLAIGCGILVASTGFVALRVAAGVLGTMALLVGHLGLWIVVLGWKAGKSRLTYDVGVLREVSPAMHALTQGLVILIGLGVLLGGASLMLAAAFGGFGG